MKKFALALISLSLLTPIVTTALTEQEYLKRLEEITEEREPLAKSFMIQKLLAESSEYERFTILAIAAKTAYLAKDYNSAERYANELLGLAGKYSQDWNYGNAIHDGNMLLGRVAVRNGKIKSGARYLLDAGKTPGSPQLNSFGPNMSLAKDLLEHDEKQAVIKYLELCKSFWKLEDGRLDSWIASIRGGGKPYYGANLHY